ncbi:MAG: hypothetical protein KDJ27_01840 [Gammaproteobacteria bacterium]|nr:hypothetical protein [Gammaproteobacteria bacterium]
MEWHLAYEIDRSGSGEQFYGFILMGLVLAIIAIALHLRARRHGEQSAAARMIGVGAVLVGVLGYGVNAWDQRRLADLLDGGAALTVEGPVSAHQIWREDVTNPKTDSARRFRKWETVTVSGVAFIWHPGAREAAFTNAQSPTITFRDGLMVRIAYVEDVANAAHQRRILRVETADSPGTHVLPGAPFPSIAPPY